MTGWRETKVFPVEYGVGKTELVGKLAKLRNAAKSVEAIEQINQNTPEDLAKLQREINRISDEDISWWDGMLSWRKKYSAYSSTSANGHLLTVKRYKNRLAKQARREDEWRDQRLDNEWARQHHEHEQREHEQPEEEHHE